MSHEIVLVFFYFATLIYSVIIHEISHGVVALWLGDITAKYEGRLSLKPWSHVDPFGTLFLPIMLGLISHGGLVFGYAKPVPVNPYNLRDQKWGQLWVALAGPGSNFLVAGVAALIAKLIPISLGTKQLVYSALKNLIEQNAGFLDAIGVLSQAMSGSFGVIFYGLLLVVISWNIMLGCFNLIPFPPLDGSRILFTFFNVSSRTQAFLEQYGIFLLFFFVFFFQPFQIFLSDFITFFLNLFFRFTF